MWLAEVHFVPKGASPVITTDEPVLFRAMPITFARSDVLPSHPFRLL